MTKAIPHSFGAAVLAVALTFTVSSAGVTAAPQALTPTWTVPMSGVATGTGHLIAQHVQVGWTMNCDTVEAKVMAHHGSGMTGDGVVAITSIAFAPTGGTCEGPLGVTMDVTADSVPLKFDAKAYDPRTGVVAGRVSGVAVTVESSDGCVLTVTGQADATYDNNSGTIALDDRDHLRIATVTPACASAALKAGDSVTVEGSFDLTPAGVITSP
ncbi:MAG: hypothetical protein HOY71_33895 [Nonomuraea sp.]|nr:hypothetical protein [Nonomuraea sp.]